jgi:hypothetical protein
MLDLGGVASVVVDNWKNTRFAKALFYHEYCSYDFVVVCLYTIYFVSGLD